MQAGGNMMIYRILGYLIVFLASAGAVYAQPDRRDVRKGNRDFRKEEWKSAEIDYRKALVKDSSSLAANYNLANTLYKMGDAEQSARIYDSLKDSALDSEIAADWHYNRGNAASAMKDWQAAVDAYRQALLLNPSDMDAKENYIYAREMLKDQQNRQNQDNQQDSKDQDNRQNNNEQQNQDNQDDQQNRNDSNQQDENDRQNPQNQDKPQPQQDGNGGSEPRITPQAAQQMLQAIQAKEKETQEKVKKEKAEILKSRQKEKNW